jgi:uncharacterized protein (TIGR00255 family)
MTGFGKASSRINGRKVDVEIRSLNSKQLDLNMRLPSIYREIEPDIRNLINNTLHRGKVDLFINISSEDGIPKASLNKEIAKQYYKELKALGKSIGEKNVSYLPLIVRMPEVFKTEEVADKKELKDLLAIITKATHLVTQFRIQEGKVLKKDIESHLGEIEKKEKEVDNLDAKRVEKIRERLDNKIKELCTNDMIDRNRLEQEIIYYIEKLDINEERQRLKAHCNYFKQTMQEDNGGRKLGFIIQEIGREINTLGSKANDAGIQKIVVEMKDELEKMKEQLLNIL